MNRQATSLIQTGPFWPCWPQSACLWVICSTWPMAKGFIFDNSAGNVVSQSSQYLGSKRGKMFQQLQILWKHYTPLCNSQNDVALLCKTSTLDLSHLLYLPFSVLDATHPESIPWPFRTTNVMKCCLCQRLKKKTKEESMSLWACSTQVKFHLPQFSTHILVFLWNKCGKVHLL